MSDGQRCCVAAPAGSDGLGGMGKRGPEAE